MYKVNLQIDLTGPDDELELANETYVTFERELHLDFVPFPNLLFRMKPDISDENKEKFSELFNKLANVSGIFQVEDVIHDVPKSEYDFEVVLKPLGENSLKQFHALQEFMGFYGFTKFF